MSYILSSTTIRSPSTINENNRTQVAQNQAIDGTVNRDYFGNNKRVWELRYRNVSKAVNPPMPATVALMVRFRL